MTDSDLYAFLQDSVVSSTNATLESTQMAKKNLGPNVVKSWEMPSSTNPAKKYTVLMHTDSKFSCNCPAWTFKKSAIARNCPHIIAIQTVLRLDSVDEQIKQQSYARPVQRHITRLVD